MPGISYLCSPKGKKDLLEVGFSEAIRRWIVYPTELAKVRPPVTVDRTMVETPMLLSSAGAAVTLLNWTGEPLERLNVTIRVPFKVGTVESVRHGRLTFQSTRTGSCVPYHSQAPTSSLCGARLLH
jgi:hypothetical protein